MLNSPNHHEELEFSRLTDIQNPCCIDRWRSHLYSLSEYGVVTRYWLAGRSVANKAQLERKGRVFTTIVVNRSETLAVSWMAKALDIGCECCVALLSPKALKVLHSVSFSTPVYPLYGILQMTR